MKFCSRPYNHMHIDPDGNVRICSWTDISIGNILEQNIDDIWHGEKAEELRKSFEDGSFRYCRKTSCPYLENCSLPDISEEEYKKKGVTRELPKSFNVANDFICNHSCPSCRDKVFCPDEKYIDNLNKMMIVILPLLNQADSFTTCGNGDLFASKYIMDMLSQVHPENPSCQIGLETNGALFNENNWKKIEHLGKYNLKVTVTPNSFDKDTHYYLCGGHDTYDAVISNLKLLRKLREQNIVNFLEISIVLQDKNYNELPSFAERSINEFGADEVTVKPLYRWFGLSDEMYWFKDVINPLHPYHKDYLKMMQNKVLKNEKVFFWGADNLHTDRRHPAYFYKDIAMYLKNMLVYDNYSNKLSKALSEVTDGRVFVYGENILTEPFIEKAYEGNIELAGIIAKKPESQEISGIKVTKLKNYDFMSSDTLIIMNYDKMDFIMRDLDFMGYDGQIITADQILNKVQEMM